MKLLRPALFLTTLLGFTLNARAIEIVLDYTLDEENYNWFNPNTNEGVARRKSLQAAASFLSAIISNDDWNPISSFNEAVTFSDLSESSIKGLSGQVIAGSAESDGAGYRYSIPLNNRSSLAANEYVVYVGAFIFDAGTSSHAKGGWDSNDRRNAAGFARTEFNTWGGRIWFNINVNWYTGSNPGVNPTNNYGTQDGNKIPSFDTSADNWDWHTTLLEWKGFQLSSIDPSIGGSDRDLYGIALHELMHALGLTSSNIGSYIEVNGNGDAISPNLLTEYGAPVPIDSGGGHFANGIQSEVWDSPGIISEVVLDPSSTNARRKYFTRIDAAALRDLGYVVASQWDEVGYDYKVSLSVSGSEPQLTWPSTGSHTYSVDWSSNLTNWTSVTLNENPTWTDPAGYTSRRFYRVND